MIETNPNLTDMLLLWDFTEIYYMFMQLEQFSEADVEKSVKTNITEKIKINLKPT